MAKSTVLLENSFRPESPLREDVKPGLRALASHHLKLIAEKERPRAGDSLQLEEATRRKDPHSRHWDYLISLPDAGTLTGLEPHEATDSEIRVVIQKREHAIEYLREHFITGRTVARWIWVSPGSVGFTSTEKATRKLSQAGIEFAGRVVRSLG